MTFRTHAEMVAEVYATDPRLAKQEAKREAKAVKVQNVTAVTSAPRGLVLGH